MNRSTIILLTIFLSFSLGACGKFNPMNLFQKEGTAESVAKPKPMANKESPSAPIELSISGVYQTQGTNPGGQGSYHGTTTLTKESGNKYHVHWEVGTVYDGVGILEGKVFTVDWGRGGDPVGKVTYTVEANGILKGTWFTYKNPDLLGTETLTPSRLGI